VDARIDVITLAVEDFERAFAFYRALGFESKGVVATEFTGDDTRPAGAIAMVHLQGGQILSLYPRSELAKDAGIPRGPVAKRRVQPRPHRRNPRRGRGAPRQSRSCRTPVTELHDRPLGIYSGYFRDPDGHLWEIIHNPNRTDSNA
jgi:catechol 2,3-dioxygenase-like lactoylglutathione lyase family enzyme